MTHRLASRACRLVQDRMTAQPRSATEQFDFAQARDFQALRPEAAAIHLAGILCDSGCDLDQFADLAATSSLVRDALAKATRWRSIPIPIAGNDARVERAVDAISATARPARSPYHEIGAANAALFDGAGASPRPRSDAPADLSEEIAA